jgi:hypothetical protein
MRIKFLLLVLCALLTTQAEAASRVFHDDFEGYSAGTLPGTPWSVSGTPQVVTSAADGVTGTHGGSKMLRTNHPGTSVTDQAHTPTITYTDEVLYRFWLRADTNHDGQADPGTGVKYLRFFIFSGSFIIDKFVVYHRTGTGMVNSGQFGDVNDPQNTYFGGASGDTSDTFTRWQRVQMWFKNSTGSCKIWNDGILITDISGRNLGGLQATSIDLVSNGGPSLDSTNYMYFDDIEVFSDQGSESCTGTMANGDISCGGSPPPAPRHFNLNLNLRRATYELPQELFELFTPFTLFCAVGCSGTTVTPPLHFIRANTGASR